jgi:hypothetical protein
MIRVDSDDGALELSSVGASTRLIGVRQVHTDHVANRKAGQQSMRNVREQCWSYPFKSGTAAG